MLYALFVDVPCNADHRSLMHHLLGDSYKAGINVPIGVGIASLRDNTGLVLMFTPEVNTQGQPRRR